jgi:hypothetical protein
MIIGVYMFIFAGAIPGIVADAEKEIERDHNPDVYHKIREIGKVRMIT